MKIDLEENFIVLSIIKLLISHTSVRIYYTNKFNNVRYLYNSICITFTNQFSWNNYMNNYIVISDKEYFISIIRKIRKTQIVKTILLNRNTM